MKVSRLALAASLVMCVAYAEGTTPGANNGNAASTAAPVAKKPTAKKKAAKSAAKAQSHASADTIKTSAASEAVLGTAPSNNVSATTAAPGLMQTLNEKVAFSYFGIYRGAAVNDPSNKYQPDISGAQQGASDQDSAQSFENFVTVGYKPAKDWMVGVSLHSFYHLAQTTNIDNSLVSGWELLDPSLELTKANLIDAGALKMKGYAFVELPTNQNDLLRANNHKTLTAVTAAGNFTYDMTSRLSLAAYTYLRGYVPSAGNNTRSYRFVVAPNANYQLTPTVAATLWIDLIDLRRNNGFSNSSPFFSTSGLHNAESDIEPGINWDIVPGRLSVNPQINIYPSNPTLAATSFQAVIVGKAF